MFDRDLCDHMAAEEETLVPLYEREHPAAAARLREEHRRFREAAAEIGVDIDLHCVRAEAIDALAEQLRAHAEREDATLYPWLAEHVPTLLEWLERIREHAAQPRH